MRNLTNILGPLLSTAIVFAMLLLTAWLFVNYGNTIRPSTDGLVVFGILLVSYLIFSGKIAEIGGAGFTLRLRQFSTESKVFEIFRGTEIKNLVTDSQTVAKSTESDLKNVIVPSLFRDRVTALSLKKGGNYDAFKLYDYLRYMLVSPYFRDVIFVDEQERFQGRMEPDLLLRLLNFVEVRGPIVASINEWKLRLVPGMTMSCVANTENNRDVLLKMQRERISLMPVVNSDGKFVGVVSREDILDSPILELLTMR